MMNCYLHVSVVSSIETLLPQCSASSSSSCTAQSSFLLIKPIPSQPASIIILLFAGILKSSDQHSDQNYLHQRKAAIPTQQSNQQSGRHDPTAGNALNVSSKVLSLVSLSHWSHLNVTPFHGRLEVAQRNQQSGHHDGWQRSQSANNAMFRMPLQRLQASFNTCLSIPFKFPTS